MIDGMMKLYAKDSNKVALHAALGHFATIHSHVNYYIDVTSLKSRVNEAQEVASLLVDKFANTTLIDTIVCLDGTEVIGGFLGEQFEDKDFLSTNMHETIYVVRPEFSNGQMIFRENNLPAIRGKHIVLLLATTTMGETIKRSIECIKYYGGIVESVASIFSLVDEVDGYEVYSLFDGSDVPEYHSYPQKECPMCKNKIPLDAMVNGFGFSRV